MSSSVFNQQIIERFKQLWQSSKLAHAYLFIGPAHSGKLALCLHLAQLFNCQNPQAPCGQCPSCRKIEAGIHPDVMVIKPLEDKQTVSIDQMREVISRLSYSAYEGNVKVVILPLVEHLTMEATNAFLKTLEEPTKKTVILLTAVNIAVVLDTIKSRCQWVRMSPQDHQTIIEALYQDNVDTSQAEWLARASNGFLPVALNMAEMPQIKDRQVIIKSFLSSRAEDDTIKALLEDKDAAKETLMMLMSLMADVMATKSAKVLHVTWNQDLIREVEGLSKLSMNELLAIYQQIIMVYRQLQENLNAKMSFLVLKEQLCQPLFK